MLYCITTKEKKMIDKKNKIKIYFYIIIILLLKTNFFHFCQLFTLL